MSEQLIVERGKLQRLLNSPTPTNSHSRTMTTSRTSTSSKRAARRKQKPGATANATPSSPTPYHVCTGCCTGASPYLAPNACHDSMSRWCPVVSVAACQHALLTGEPATSTAQHSMWSAPPAALALSPDATALATRIASVLEQSQGRAVVERLVSLGYAELMAARACLEVYARDGSVDLDRAVKWLRVHPAPDDASIASHSKRCAGRSDRHWWCCTQLPTVHAQLGVARRPPHIQHGCLSRRLARAAALLPHTAAAAAAAWVPCRCCLVAAHTHACRRAVWRPGRRQAHTGQRHHCTAV